MTSICEYDKTRHKQDVVRALRSAFAHNFRPFWENATGYGEAVLDLLDAAADLKLVLIDERDGSAGGAIFCVAPLTIERALCAASGMAVFTWRRLIGAVRMETEAKNFERELMRAYLPIFLRYPLHHPHYEIVLFAMESRMRGKGYGRLLMDEAVRRMRARGADDISLLTDSTMSWKFYASYGFSRSHTHELGDAYRRPLASESEQAYIYNLSKNNKRENIHGKSNIP
mgnify:CR=1 FL=1